MRTLIGMLLLSVTLSPPFGEAEARAVDVGPDRLVLEVQVEIDEPALVVLARPVGRLNEFPPVALAELDDGRWGGIVELAFVEDIGLGFELIRPDGGSAIVSEVSRLSDLGVDPAIFDVGRPATTAVPSARERPAGGGSSVAPIWLAIAAGAAALALLLVWWLAGSNRESDEPVPSEGDEVGSRETSDPDSSPER